MKTLLSIITVFFSLNAFSQNPSPAVMGLRKALATAYQSCESLQLKPMARSIADVEGVENNGRYPDSLTGHYVKITDPKAVARTHYYIREYRPTPGCVNVQNYPMVYDYGGKPSTKDGTLNYWITSNGGSPGLGIDCSGFVFTSLAVGGLRLKSGKALRAAEVHQYPARMYVHPDQSGFSCLAPKKVGTAGVLKPGDILASDYHVAMVESVGADPFGLKKHSNCVSITYKDFDFVIAQSSPDQNNIGINKYEAREYLAEFSTFLFRWGLERYAKEACEAQRKKTDVVPYVKYFGISEHKMTAECQQPAIALRGESCIQECPEIFE
ncbi:hypothetical protein [Bdellovibrio sp. HCB337]|uniref:hypothetical protein n=1 Tax=Bdellovibrio sp. HCB337 TaxID=3394358 RepID=UPI0039A4CF00